MSGPKVDVVALRGQEMQRLEAAREKRKSLADKLISRIQQLRQCMVTPDSEVSGRIAEIQNENLKKLNELLEEVCHGNELLNCDLLETEVNVLLAEYDRQIRPYVAEMERIERSVREQQRMEQQKRELSQITRSKIRAVAADTSADVEEMVTMEAVFEQVQSFVQEIKSFVSQPGMPTGKKNSILSLHRELMEISRSAMDAEKKSRRIANLYEDFDQIRAMAERELSEMRYIYDRYIRECFDVAGGVRAFEEFHSREEIEEAIRLGKESAKDQVSKEYIRRQIDEVMAKHGYDVIRSDQLREAPADGQVLYGVNDQTAINVFVSADDQVTMRVVGIGFDEGLTATENENLFQQQCAFCSLHPQITAELKMRGVILTTKKHLPPDRKYNKKVQTNTKQTTQTTTSRAKKELKRAEKKVMYKG